MLFCPPLEAKEKRFTLVLDAGHGGKDPGARGANINEKAINLSVVLKLGQLITANHPDVNIVYTRKTDVFVELDERANIANRNKADLFISVHTNAVKRGSNVVGTETYTMGLARTDENLEVAMRENAAILLEDDYMQKYEGFDPSSSESYIIFEFMQNKHLEQSVSLASLIQKSFTTAHRVDRGVRQAGFLVLRKTSMPSVLIELGYISNAAEERFMKTADGQSKLATAIYNAFTKYKNEYDRKQGALANGRTTAPILDIPETTVSVADDPSVPAGSEADIQRRKANASSSTASKTENTSTTTGQVIYKVQVLTSNKKLSTNSPLLKGYGKRASYYEEKGLYKYTIGETTSFSVIRKLRRDLAKDFKDAFIVAFKDGQKVDY